MSRNSKINRERRQAEQERQGKKVMDILGTHTSRNRMRSLFFNILT